MILSSMVQMKNSLIKCMDYDESNQKNLSFQTQQVVIRKDIEEGIVYENQQELSVCTPLEFEANE